MNKICSLVEDTPPTFRMFVKSLGSPQGLSGSLGETGVPHRGVVYPRKYPLFRKFNTHTITELLYLYCHFRRLVYLKALSATPGHLNPNCIAKSSFLQCPEVRDFPVSTVLHDFRVKYVIPAWENAKNCSARGNISKLFFCARVGSSCSNL